MLEYVSPGSFTEKRSNDVPIPSEYSLLGTYSRMCVVNRRISAVIRPPKIPIARLSI